MESIKRADQVYSPDQMVSETERTEIKLLLEAIYQLYGYDFRNYVFPSIRRRLWYRAKAEKLKTISALQDKVLHHPDCMQRLIKDLSIQVTEMFRNPECFQFFRKKVIPLLKDLPEIRVWHAGCSTGEEVYSMAILLYEEDLLDKTLIYATDMDEEAIKKAKRGSFPLKNMREYTTNYIQAGGRQSFSQYYQVTDSDVYFSDFLQNKMVYFNHNLATDGSFHEFHLISCRNVMIYFNKELQEKVHTLFLNSLTPSGFLILGDKESIKFTSYEKCYKEFDSNHKIYQRI